MQHKQLKVIAALEVIGGIYGLGLVLFQLIESPINLGAIIPSTIVAGFYFFALAAGLALWQGLGIGRNASIIVQFVQFPKIITNPFVFQFSLGIDLYALFYRRYDVITNVGLHAKFGAYHELFIGVPGDHFGTGFSVVALAFIVMLLRQDGMENAYGRPP